MEMQPRHQGTAVDCPYPDDFVHGVPSRTPAAVPNGIDRAWSKAHNNDVQFDSGSSGGRASIFTERDRHIRYSA
jgi:hypothetical protein